MNSSSKVSIDPLLSEFQLLKQQEFSAQRLWVKSLRESGVNSLLKNGLPGRWQEEWRFSPMGEVVEMDFSQSDTKSQSFNEEILPSEPGLVFVNGFFSEKLSCLESLPEGITLLPLASCMTSTAESGLKPELGRYLDVHTFPYGAVNTMFFKQGAVVRIEAGKKITEQLNITFVVTETARNLMTHPRNLIVAGEGAEATVVERYLSTGSEAYWTNSVTEVLVEKKAVLNHYKVQKESESAYHFHCITGEVAEGGRYSGYVLTAGSAKGRNDIQMNIRGEGAEVNLDGLYLTRKEQLIDTHSWINHSYPGSVSNQLYKGILGDKSRGVFCGRVNISKDAQESKAFQCNRNLLLSEGARVNSMPQLEILADNVSCSHGATTGEIDVEGLFYLKSRGLSSSEAMELMTFGFANETLHRLDDSIFRKEMEEEIKSWLAIYNGGRER